jgi:hypothetical protein
LWNDLQGWTALSDEERREQWRALEAEREKNGSPIDRNRRDEFNAFVFFWLDNQTPVYEKAHWWSILSAAEVYLTFGADAAETETLMNDTRKSKAAMSDWLTDFGFPPLGDPEREAKDIAALFAGDDINVWELTPSAIPKRRLNLVRQGEKAAADLERQRAGLISQAEGLGLTVLADEARTASADVLQRIGQDIFHELDYRRKLKELASLTQDRARQTRTDEVEKVNHAWDIAGERAAAKTLERH